MGRKKTPTGVDVVAGLVAAPFYIAGGIAKAALTAAEKAEKERRAREIAERKQQAAIAKAERERKRQLAEQERIRKQDAKAKEQQEAAASRREAAYAALEDRYAIAINRHRQLTQLITTELAAESPDDAQIIEYCWEDIDVIPLFYDYQLRRNLMRGTDKLDRDYDAHLILSEAYERRGEYDHAILACRRALEMGILYAHGTNFKDRIKQLEEIKKAG